MGGGFNVLDAVNPTRLIPGVGNVVKKIDPGELVNAKAYGALPAGLKKAVDPIGTQGQQQPTQQQQQPAPPASADDTEAQLAAEQRRRQQLLMLKQKSLFNDDTLNGLGAGSV